MNPFNRQRTLAIVTGFERYSKKKRRATFLEEMEQMVPWEKLCALIELRYSQPATGDGREGRSRPRTRDFTQRVVAIKARS